MSEIRQPDCCRLKYKPHSHCADGISYAWRAVPPRTALRGWIDRSLSQRGVFGVPGSLLSDSPRGSFRRACPLHDASTGARRALSCRSRRGASFGDSDGSCWSSSDCAQPLQLLPGRRRAGRPFSGDHSAHTCSDSWQQIGAGQLTRRSALALRRSETSARSCAGPRGGGGTAGQNSERIEEKMVEAAGVGSAPILKFLKNLEKPKRSIGENWLNDIGREGAAQNRERPTARASQRRKSLVEKVEELKKRQKK